MSVAFNISSIFRLVRHRSLSIVIFVIITITLIIIVDDTMSNENIITSFENKIRFYEWLLIAFALITLGITARMIILKSRLNDENKMTIAQLEKATQDARTKQKDSDVKIASATERAEVAIAKQKELELAVEQERIKRLELQSLFEPRNINIEELGKQLKPFSKLKAIIEYPSTGQEPGRLAAQIYKALKLAGWETIIHGVMIFGDIPDPTMENVTIFGNMDALKEPLFSNGVSVLITELEKYIVVNGFSGVRTAYDNRTIDIEVGFKTNPYLEENNADANKRK
jgi:hypothetical protein